MKYFNKEIQRFYDKLKSGENFSFSKYADGEWMALKAEAGSPGNGEWTIGPETEASIDALRASFVYRDPGYYVGISCPCCQGDNHFAMREASGQDDEHLTFANLFVNANYQYFLDNFIPEFSKREVVLVANENSETKLHKLPFDVKAFFPVSYNAWVDDLDLAEYIKFYNFKDSLVLFSCGPLGNILAHQLWDSNKLNTYIDVGSTLDKWLQNDNKNPRCYARGDNVYSGRQCVWGHEVKIWKGSILR